MRVSKCSRLSLFTCGERNTQKMRRFVGSGTGPETRASVAFAASRILSHALCMWFVSKDRRRMRILDACTAAACAVAARAFVVARVFAGAARSAEIWDVCVANMIRVAARAGVQIGRAHV